MPNVTINSQSISNVVTADVINIRDIVGLSEAQRQSLIKELADVIDARLEQMSVSLEIKDQIRTQTNAVVSSTGADARQKQMQGLFATLRSCFGDAAEVVCAAAKIAQILFP